MSTKLELERELEDMREQLDEAHAILSEALDPRDAAVEDDDDEDDDDEDDDENDEEEEDQDDRAAGGLLGR
jgi:hypothetical protein